MMTDNYDILLKYSLAEPTSAQALRCLNFTDEQSLNKLELDAKLPLPKLDNEETGAMQTRFSQMLDNAAVKLEPWYLVEGTNKILCKHQFHKAFDQEFIYKADKDSKKLDIYIQELDIMLLKWFLYIHVPGLIDPELKNVDDYKIIITVRDEYHFFGKIIPV